jgi:zinc protease
MHQTVRLTTRVLLAVTAALAFTRAPAATGEAAQYSEHVCRNGLVVLVVENHATPLVTVEIAFKNGSMTESPEYNGLSHLYEHMFFKANAVLPSQEAYLARLRQLGAEWNGTTNTERVNYFFTAPSAHTRELMTFMRDAVVSPAFEPREFEKERVVVTGEIDRNESNPGYHFFHEVGKHVWWKYPSYKDPLGRRATVLSATTDMMRTIQRLYYVPNNALLMVAGDVTPAQIFEQTDSLYAKWERAEDPFRKHPLVVHPPIPKTETVLVEQPVRTVSMTMTWHGPSTVGPGVELTYAADLLGTAVSQPSSKFQRDLVDSGACVRAGFSWFTQRNVGPVTLSLEAAPEKAAVCLAAARAELPRMAEADYLSAAERSNAVLSLEMDIATGRERPSQFAHTLTFWWTSAGLDYYRTYVENVRKVQPGDVARFLGVYVLGKPFVFGAMISPAMVKDNGLDRARFENLLSSAAPNPSPAPASSFKTTVDGDVTSADVKGIQVVVKRVPSADLVAMNLYVRGGVQNWDKETAGIEKVALAAAAAGGTARLPRESFARRLETMGSTLTAASGDDFSSLRSKCIKAKWADTLDLLADAFLEPSLPAAEIEQQRQLQLSNLRRELENPDGQLRLLMRKSLFAGHPYERRSEGSLESIAVLTRDAAAAHLSKLRQTSRLLLVVVGDVDPAAAFARVAAAFDGVPRTDFREAPIPPLAFDHPSVTVEKRELPTNYIESAFAMPGPRDAGYAAAQVGTYALNSREFEEVRTKRNLSYAAAAITRRLLDSPRAGWGFLYVTATDPIKTLPVMFAEAARLKDEPIQDTDLAAFKEQYLTGLFTDMESLDGQAEALARAQIILGDFREVPRFVSRIRAVTPSDVQAFAKKAFVHFRTVGVGDPASIEKAAQSAP